MFAETQWTDGLAIADRFFEDKNSFLDERDGTIFVEALETEKSLDRMPAIIERLRALGATRKTRLQAVGGGVVQDIAAFVASVYMRGLPWNYTPTTVLAMVDSCIGGKSSINVGPYKNLVGTFHPPQHIYVDPALAETLPRDQFASGLIEAAKICFCRGAESFARYLACEPGTSMATSALEEVILTSLLAKKHFIEVDEFDKKERLLLNFGHTFGHAIEGASHYGIPHGIAVGIGILCSLEFQRERGVSYAGVRSVAELEKHLIGMIRMLPGLREQLADVLLDDMLQRFGSDKKHTRERYTLILVGADGAVGLEQMERGVAMDDAIRRAVERTVLALVGS
jgi:3-dehydroquinate synthase